MSFAKQFNRVSFSVDTTGFEYCKLKDLYTAKTKNKVYRLDGLFVNRSPLGLSPVFIVADLKKLVNIPSHLTETAQTILSDVDAVEQIEGGKVGFTLYTYESHGRECYGVKFVDL